MSNYADPSMTTTSQPGEVFKTDVGVLAVVARAIATTRGCMQATVEGVGEVWIDASTRRYVANVADWSAFGLAPTARVRVAVASMPADASQRDLAELQWTLAYWASAGRLPAGVGQHTVIKLSHWPNLSRLPHSPEMYRLCALLARRPSSIRLASRLVGVDEPEMFRFFSAAHACGAIEILAQVEESSTFDAEFEAKSAPLSETSLTSMVKLLWAKMTGR